MSWTTHLAIVFDVADMGTVTHLERISRSSVEIDVVDTVHFIVAPGQPHAAAAASHGCSK